jgi:hypothetical protein
MDADWSSGRGEGERSAFGHVLSSSLRRSAKIAEFLNLKIEEVVYALAELTLSLS